MRHLCWMSVGVVVTFWPFCFSEDHIAIGSDCDELGAQIEEYILCSNCQLNDKFFVFVYLKKTTTPLTMVLRSSTRMFFFPWIQSLRLINSWWLLFIFWSVSVPQTWRQQPIGLHASHSYYFPGGKTVPGVNPLTQPPPPPSARIFQEFKNTDMKYKNRVRSRISNLKDVKNPNLRRTVLCGNVSPERMAGMSAEVR